MGLWYDMRRSLRRAIAPCLGICALLYFGYHTVQGDRSIIAYLRLNSQLARVNIELAESNEARAILTRGNPQGRLIQPDEVAATVGWLCQPSSASITGQAIAVAGGEVM